MDLLQRSIYENCKLALPSGLTELMSDISREVLRAQPNDLYQFITDYLAAMLVTRENISVAAHLCNELCTGICSDDLDDKLREIDLNEEDIEKVKAVVSEYFKKETVNESNLLMELTTNTNIDKEKLAAVQEAVREAFKQQKLDDADFLETSENENNDVSKAVKHTLELYKETKPSKEICHRLPVKIEASHRAYGVRRDSSDEFPQPTKQVYGAKRVILDIDEDDQVSSPPSLTSCFRTVSSTNVAGSYVNLPKYRPYSPHDSNVAM